MPVINSAAFTGAESKDANLLFYKYDADNWSGIGVTPSGVPVLSFGVGSRQLYTFNYNGIYLNGFLATHVMSGEYRANVIFGKIQGSFIYSTCIYFPNADQYNITITEAMCHNILIFDVSTLSIYRVQSNGFSLKCNSYGEQVPGYITEIAYFVTPKS